MVHGKGGQRSPIHLFSLLIHFINIKEQITVQNWPLYGSSAKYVYISRSFKRSIFQSIEAGR